MNIPENEEAVAVEEAKETGLSALLSAVYGDPNFAAAEYIRRPVSKFHMSSRVTVMAELTDRKTVVMATEDSEIQAMRTVLAKIRAIPGLMPDVPTGVSNPGLLAIQRREGLELEAYRDVAGHLTIGYGHLMTQSEITSGKLRIGDRVVRWRDGVTEPEAEALLMEDVSDFEECVEVYVKAPLAQHQYDALVSFALNVGCAALRDSTLLRRLNDRDYNAVPAQLMRWVYAGGRKRHGLINRRKSEVEQWRGGLN